MTALNERKIVNREQCITMTTRREKGDKLIHQKAAGLVMLALSAAALFWLGDFSAAAVMSPLALAAVFSKEKILDFGIFGKAR